MTQVVNKDIEIVLEDRLIGEGDPGTNGADGLSAYQIWLGLGNVGTEQDFIDAITGADGQDGADGSDGAAGAAGTNGTDGADGADGADGVSAYIYVGYADTNTGGGFTTTFNSSKDYIAILNTTSPIATPLVSDFTGLWKRVASGLSAYQIWLALGNSGSEQTFIDSLKGPAGTAGTNGVDGKNAYFYVAYADGLDGSGFVAPGETFDPSKKYMAVISTNTIIPAPAVTDFEGRWVRYLGDGDRWSTTSDTSLTIGTGTKSLGVEAGLAYVTGQAVVIAESGNANNRMTGLVDSYNYSTGDLVVEVDASNGSGTISNWVVSLSGEGAGSGATNLTNTPSPTGILLESSSGTDTTLPLATETNAGLMAPADKANMVDDQDQTEQVIAGPSFGIDFDIKKWYSHDADVGGSSVLNYINYAPMKGLRGHLVIETHGSDGVPGRAFVISTTNTKAAGVLTLTGNYSDGDTVEIGGETYTFQTTLTNVDKNVLIGATASDSIDNLIAAITLGAGSGTLYAAATTIHPTVTATAGTGDTMDAEAKTAGGQGNLITTTENSANSSWGAATLTGGTSDVFADMPDGQPDGFYDNEVPYMTLEFWRAGNKLFGVWLENAYVKEIDPA